MPYARLDDGFHSHPTTTRMGNACAGVYARAIAYCACFLTDGYIPAQVLFGLADSKRQVSRLVELGCIEERGDAYYLIDYLKHNPARAEVEERKRDARERVRKHRMNKGLSSEDEASSPEVCNALRNAYVPERSGVQEQASQASKARRGNVPELKRENLITWVKAVGVQFEEPGFTEELERLTSDEVLRQEVRRLYRELRAA